MKRFVKIFAVSAIAVALTAAATPRAEAYPAYAPPVAVSRLVVVAPAPAFCAGPVVYAPYGYYHRPFLRARFGWRGGYRHYRRW